MHINDIQHFKIAKTCILSYQHDFAIYEAKHTCGCSIMKISRILH